MSTQKLKTVESLFAAALGLEGEQLENFLAENCGDDTALRESIIELLGHDRKLKSSSFLEPSSPIEMPPPDADHESFIGQQLGAFTLTRHIGSGGMGYVYLGVRDDDFKQQAAIKIIRTGVAGEKMARRFRKEMQFLAALGKHPNITSILDAGATEDGQLYIAMEYVDGLNINEYCNTHRIGTRERLELFCKACEAVQFAHQNAILHRDLKPGNLLITPEGKPMLIDFGVAKLNANESASDSHRTQTQNQPFTPGYASPEHFGSQSVTTASDVYSLGAVLYELLAGKPPHCVDGKPLAETIKLICDTDPSKPSSVPLSHEFVTARGVSLKRLKNELRGDLDRIVIKAIDRDIDRRYPTVQQLTEDVQRFLDGKPVKAQPDSLGYRLKKYVRRNALAVMTAIAFVLMLLVAIGITSRLAVVARSAALAEREQASLAKLSADSEREQRIIAEKQEQNAKKVIEIFDRFTASSDPRKTGDPDYPARQLFKEFADDLQERSVEDPLVEARLLQSLASALTGLGDYRAARPKAEKAASLLSEHLGPKHRSTLAAKLLVARVLLLNHAPRMAADALRQVIAMDDPAQKDDPDWNLIQFNALASLAEAERLSENLDDAELALTLAESKVALIEVSAKAKAKDTLQRTRKQLLIDRGNLDQVLPSAKADYEKARQLYGESDFRTAEAGDQLSSIYLKQQRYDLAIELYESSFRISRQLFGEDRQNTLLQVMRLAETNCLAENYAAADSWFRIYDPLYSALKRYGGHHHYGLLFTWSECLCKLGKFDEAEELLHRCYSYHALVCEKEQGADCHNIRTRLIALFRAAGRDELADQWLVPPETPSPVQATDFGVGRSGEVTLVASGFLHAAGDMKHHATRWQLRAAGETFEYSPTLDVTTTEHLEQFVIPPGILLPNQNYFWRVAHVGQNRAQSDFSETMSFQSDELVYELKPFDLTRHFNRDVVYSPGDQNEDAFKPLTKQLVIDGYSPDRSSEEKFHGVPQDGVIGPHQLGDYQNHNAIQLDHENTRVNIELPQANLSSIRILIGAFLNGYRRHEDALKVTLVYADGTRSERRVHCPDWNLKVDHRDLKSGSLPAIIVRHGIDRGYINGGVERANNALFDVMVPVDSSRKLASISIVADDEGPLNPGARINIFAITGVAPKNLE